MDAGHAFLLVETAATIFMSGVLWTMQVLNYPILSLVGQDAFIGCETAHNRRFGMVVLPGVLAAVVGAIGLQASRPLQVPSGRILRFYNGWLILNVGGGPTRDKPCRRLSAASRSAIRSSTSSKPIKNRTGPCGGRA